MGCKRLQTQKQSDFTPPTGRRSGAIQHRPAPHKHPKGIRTFRTSGPPQERRGHTGLRPPPHPRPPLGAVEANLLTGRRADRPYRPPPSPGEAPYYAGMRRHLRKDTPSAKARNQLRPPAAMTHRALTE